jgi:hypothetical protein
VRGGLWVLMSSGIHLDAAWHKEMSAVTLRRKGCARWRDRGWRGGDPGDGAICAIGRQDRCRGAERPGLRRRRHNGMCRPSVPWTAGKGSGAGSAKFDKSDGKWRRQWRLCRPSRCDSTLARVDSQGAPTVTAAALGAAGSEMRLALGMREDSVPARVVFGSAVTSWASLVASAAYPCSNPVSQLGVDDSTEARGESRATSAARRTGNWGGALRFKVQDHPNS